MTGKERKSTWASFVIVCWKKRNHLGIKKASFWHSDGVHPLKVTRQCQSRRGAHQKTTAHVDDGGGDTLADALNNIWKVALERASDDTEQTPTSHTPIIPAAWLFGCLVGWQAGLGHRQDVHGRIPEYVGAGFVPNYYHFESENPFPLVSRR